MARETGLHRRCDSPYWWFNVVLPNGRRIRQSARTKNREEAEALLLKLKHDAFREAHLGIKPKHTWQEAVVGISRLRNACGMPISSAGCA